MRRAGLAPLRSLRGGVLRPGPPPARPHRSAESPGHVRRAPAGADGDAGRCASRWSTRRPTRSLQVRRLGFHLRLGRAPATRGSPSTATGAGLAQRRLAGLAAASARQPHARFQLEAATPPTRPSLTIAVRRARARAASTTGATLWVDSLSLSPRGRVWLGRRRVPHALRPRRPRARRSVSGSPTERSSRCRRSPSPTRYPRASRVRPRHGASGRWSAATGTSACARARVRARSGAGAAACRLPPPPVVRRDTRGPRSRRSRGATRRAPAGRFRWRCSTASRWSPSSTTTRRSTAPPTA